jgi:hypothetical protein
MGIQILGQVGPQVITDGQLATPRLGRTAETIVTELHGKFYESASRGNVFIGSTAAAGVLIPISSTTSPTFGLWNPMGSGKNASIIRFAAGFVSTTGAPGNIGFSYTSGAGSAVATGAPISAFNSSTPANGLITAGAVSAMRFTPAGSNTISTAGTFLKTLGISQLTTTGATTTAPMWVATEDFDGTIVVPPGVFLYVVGSAALLTLFTMSISWEEVTA